MIPGSLQNIFVKFFRRTLTVKRYSGSYDVNGLWNIQLSETFDIKGSVQPSRGHEMYRDVAGRADIGDYDIYTATKLRTSLESSEDVADVVVLNDEDYEVVEVQNWQNDVISHYRIVVKKLVKGV